VTSCSSGDTGRFGDDFISNLSSYAFTSATSAKLQEIGPRFTLKLRWLRKGLPSVRTADGRMPTGGDKTADDDEYALDLDSDDEAQEKMDEDAAADEMAKGIPNPANTTPNGQRIPALDEEHEYEWKWKVSLTQSDDTNSGRLLTLHSPRWRSRAGLSSFRVNICFRTLCLVFLHVPVCICACCVVGVVVGVEMHEMRCWNSGGDMHMRGCTEDPNSVRAGLGWSWVG